MSDINAKTVMQAVDSAHKAGFVSCTQGWYAHVAEQLNPKQASGHCSDWLNCACGGDTKDIRETCPHWVKP